MPGRAGREPFLKRHRPGAFSPGPTRRTIKMLFAGFHPEMTLFGDLGVNPQGRLCEVLGDLAEAVGKPHWPFDRLTPLTKVEGLKAAWLRVE